LEVLGRKTRGSRWEQTLVAVWLVAHQLSSVLYSTTGWKMQLLKSLSETIPVSLVLLWCGSPHLPGVLLPQSALVGVVKYHVDKRDRLLYVRGLELQFLESRERKQKERTERQALQVLITAHMSICGNNH